MTLFKAAGIVSFCRYRHRCAGARAREEEESSTDTRGGMSAAAEKASQLLAAVVAVRARPTAEISLENSLLSRVTCLSQSEL